MSIRKLALIGVKSFNPKKFKGFIPKRSKPIPDANDSLEISSASSSSTKVTDAPKQGKFARLRKHFSKITKGSDNSNSTLKKFNSGEPLPKSKGPYSNSTLNASTANFKKLGNNPGWLTPIEEEAPSLDSTSGILQEQTNIFAPKPLKLNPANSESVVSEITANIAESKSHSTSPALSLNSQRSSDSMFKVSSKSSSATSVESKPKPKSFKNAATEEVNQHLQRPVAKTKTPTISCASPKRHQSVRIVLDDIPTIPEKPKPEYDPYNEVNYSQVRERLTSNQTQQTVIPPVRRKPVPPKDGKSAPPSANAQATTIQSPFSNEKPVRPFSTPASRKQELEEMRATLAGCKKSLGHKKPNEPAAERRNRAQKKAKNDAKTSNPPKEIPKSSVLRRERAQKAEANRAETDESPTKTSSRLRRERTKRAAANRLKAGEPPINRPSKKRSKKVRFETAPSTPAPSTPRFETASSTPPKPAVPTTYLAPPVTPKTYEGESFDVKELLQKLQSLKAPMPRRRTE
jgi:hypothetical protein